MTDRALLGERASRFFEELWSQGDPWRFESSVFEQEKYQRQLVLLSDRRYDRVLEIGCGSGTFTKLLAPLADVVLALDVAPAAIAEAERQRYQPATVDFRVANIMEYDPRSEGPWDLVVMSETIYYLGWLYPFFDVGWLAAQLFDATRAGGRFLMTNTCGGLKDYLLRPWLIRTYRDLFLNIGYSCEAEEVFRGTKNELVLEALILLLGKPPAGSPLVAT